MNDKVGSLLFHRPKGSNFIFAVLHAEFFQCGSQNTLIPGIRWNKAVSNRISLLCADISQSGAGVQFQALEPLLALSLSVV